MANKAYVYAIYPNKEQAELCQKTFGCCRFVYNQMLTVQQERYKNGEKHLSKLSANSYCNQHLKKDFLFLKEVDKYALTNAVFHFTITTKRVKQYNSTTKTVIMVNGEPICIVQGCGKTVSNIIAYLNGYDVLISDNAVKKTLDKVIWKDKMNGKSC